MARRFGSAKHVHKHNERIDRSNAAFYLSQARTAVRKGWCSRALDDALRAAVQLGRAAAERGGARGSRGSHLRAGHGVGIGALNKALHKCLIDRSNK